MSKESLVNKINCLISNSITYMASKLKKILTFVEYIGKSQ